MSESQYQLLVAEVRRAHQQACHAIQVSKVITKELSDRAWELWSILEEIAVDMPICEEYELRPVLKHCTVA